MSKLKDYHCCPRCGSKLIDPANKDQCESCGWSTDIPRASIVGHNLPDIQPGGVFEGNSGRYERTHEGEWLCLDSGTVYTDGELYAEECKE